MRRYIEFVERAQKINNDLALSRYELNLLDLVAKASLSGRTIFVGNLIDQRGIASQATLHAAVKALIEKELLSIKTHAGDRRVKVVFLTKSSLRMYRQLSKAMRLVLAK